MCIGHAPLVRRCRRFWDARFLNGHRARRSSQLLRRGMCGYASVEVLSQRSRRQSLSRLFGRHRAVQAWGCTRRSLVGGCVRAWVRGRFSTPSPAISRTRRVASDSKRLLTAREACTDRPFSARTELPSGVHAIVLVRISEDDIVRYGEVFEAGRFACGSVGILGRILLETGSRRHRPGERTSPLSSVTIFLGRLWGFVTG